MLTNFSAELEKQIGILILNEIYETTVVETTMKRSSFIFKVNPSVIKQDNPDKNVTVGEQLDALEVDGIGNLVDLLRLMFID